MRAYKQPRSNCWFCGRINSEISLIVRPDPPPARQFRPFSIDAHEECYKEFEKAGNLQTKKGFEK